MWIHVPKWTRDRKIFVFPINAHWKVTSPEEEFNQVHRMAHSVENQTLSSAIPVIAQYARKQNGHGGRDRVMYRLDHMESQHVWTDCSCCWVPVLPTTETNTEPGIWHHSQCYQLSPWCQVEYFGSLPLWKGRCFVLTGVDPFLDRDLHFLQIMLLTKPSSMDLKNALFTVMVFHTVLLLTN